MREAALQRRRKAAEELLLWHRRLLDEERKIGELEAAATSVVRRQAAAPDRHRFDGRQLNQMWRSMTGTDEKKFVEEKVYAMSQVALERLCKSARQHAKRLAHAQSEYSSTFEPDIISQEDKTKISSISELIDNFSRIEDEISTLSKKSEDIVSLKQDLERAAQRTQVEKNEESDGSSIKEIEEEEPSVVEIVEGNKDASREDVETIKSIDERGEDKEEIEEEKVTSEDIPTEDEGLEVATAVEEEEIISKEDLEEMKTSLEVSATVEEKIEDEEILTGKEEREIVTDGQVSTEKEHLEETVSVEEKSPTIEEEKVIVDEEEDIEEAESFEEAKSSEEVESSEEGETFEEAETFEELEAATEEISSRKEEAKSAGEVSTIEQEIIGDEEISSPKEDLEEPESEDRKITDGQISTEKDSVQQSITTKDGDLQESQLSSAQVEDLEVVTGQVSDISEALEESKNQKSLDELSLTQYKYVDKKQAEFEEKEVTSEQISTKDEESEKLEIPTSEEEASSTESESIEDRLELPSVPISVSTKEESASKEIAKSLSLEEALESASKIEESLIKLNEKLASDKKDEEISEELSTEKDVESLEETPSKTSVSTEADEKTPQKKSPNQIDVKKRVSEILADASPSRGDKSPRLQDLYVTAYDVGAPISADLNESPEEGRQMPTDIFGTEAEELWRKQLAIEQEIKQIELQQKEQLPYLYVREIPNKPPPPYTPPSSLSSLQQSIVPSDVREINEIVSYSSKVLHKAHHNANFEKVKFSENGFKLFSKIEVTKICAEFVFNLCKDVAREHYRQFDEVEEPSWLVLAKKPLSKTKPADAEGLERILNQKLKELFGFRKARTFESAIVKWGRKKRDHVDEVLVVESQEEESQWTNFDKDELIVKSQVTEDIMKMLLEETAGVFAEILSKKCAIG